MLKLRHNKRDKCLLVRNKDYVDIAYCNYRLEGIRCEIEFPSDWHEHARVWVHLGFWLFSVAFSFPWKWVVPDHYQCSGPTYGFYVFDGHLVLQWGKTEGRATDPRKSIRLPWDWRFKHKLQVGEKETHPFVWKPKEGPDQVRAATVTIEDFYRWRPWFPWKQTLRRIDVDFGEETGSRIDSWKGGVIRTSRLMLKGETVASVLAGLAADPKL